MLRGEVINMKKRANDKPKHFCNVDWPIAFKSRSRCTLDREYLQYEEHEACIIACAAARAPASVSDMVGSFPFYPILSAPHLL